MSFYYIEITDTFGGEANYTWVRRYTTEAKSPRGAMQKLSRHYGGTWRKDWDDGLTVRYNQQGACVCAFVESYDRDGWSDLGAAYCEAI